MSRGRHGHTAAGVGLGFLAGAGIGALLGARLCEGQGQTCSGSCDGCNWEPVYVLAGAGIVGLVGGGVGAQIGARHKTERWEAVPSNRWRVSAWPSASGGFALALSMRF